MTRHIHDNIKTQTWTSTRFRKHWNQPLSNTLFTAYRTRQFSISSSLVLVPTEPIKLNKKRYCTIDFNRIYKPARKYSMKHQTGSQYHSFSTIPWIMRHSTHMHEIRRLQDINNGVDTSAFHGFSSSRATGYKTSGPVLLFSKLNYVFFGYFDPDFFSRYWK